MPHFSAIEKVGQSMPMEAFNKSALLLQTADLKTDEWSESHARIVVRAAGEIYFIARLQAKTNRSKMPFHTRARVKRATDVV